MQDQISSSVTSVWSYTGTTATNTWKTTTIFFGTANRKNSEIHGFKVNLCLGHHRGSNEAVHNNRETDLLLKKMCQEEYEKTHTRQEFVQIIGKSYLGGDVLALIYQYGVAF